MRLSLNAWRTIPGVVVNLDRTEWIKAQSADPMLQRMRHAANARHFVNKDGLWYHRLCLTDVKTDPKHPERFGKTNERLVVPQSLRTTLMVIAHGLTGHRGSKPLVALISRTLYWPGVWPYVRSWVRSCSDCRRRKNLVVRQPGLVRPYQSFRPWYIIAIDFPGGVLPESEEGYIYIITVMCIFTRFPFAIPLRSKTPEEIGNALFEHVFAVFGFPQIIHSDNDRTLISKAIMHVFSRFNVGRTFTIAGHPESNAFVERFHRYLNESLTIIVTKYTDWPRLLPVLLMAYRGVVHETTGYSPHFLNCSREMRLPLEVTWGTADEQSLFDPPPASVARSYADTLVARLQAAFAMVRRAQLLVAGLNRDRVQRPESAVKFQVGDPVYFKEKTPTHRADGAMRSGYQGSDSVPQKWLFVWTGPHIVVKTEIAACTIYHSQRKANVRVHLSDLRLHHPFSDEIFDTAVSSSYVPPHKDPPPEGFTTDFPGPHALPQEGQLCVVRLPNFAPEDLCILKYLGRNKYQWYSNYSRHAVNRAKRSNIEIFATTAWLPGWVTAFDNKIVYSHRRPAATCLPFTAEAKELTSGTFIVWGFELYSSNRVRESLVKWIKERLEAEAKEALEEASPDQKESPGRA